MRSRLQAERHRAVRLAGALAVLSVALSGCNSTSEETITASVPNDYRLRHPIALREASQATVVFVGDGRGGLNASQRADIIAVAQSWNREGTGAITVEVPVETPNARPAADSAREIRSLLGAAGVPGNGIVMRHYRPADPRVLATIRVSYPRIAAVAGPCGLWPEDLGPSVMNSGYFENKPYFNLGCANQRNLAAMVDNPADLVQPRPETPAYTARRTATFDKYRKGESTATTYPESDKSKLTDTGG
jgi:pilus assembly protein CpaD